MRILLINDNFIAQGGAEIYFFELQKRLQALPNYHVFSIGFADKAAVGSDYRVFVATINNISKFIWRFIIHPILYREIRKILREFRPDIVHLHNVKQYPATLFYALRNYKMVQTIHDFSVLCPIGYNIHDDYLPCPTGFNKTCFWRHRLGHAYIDYLLRIAALRQLQMQLKRSVRHFFAPSALLTTYLRNNAFHLVTTAPPFLGALSYQPFALANPKHFLYAGQLAAHKGMYFLLEAFAAACQHDFDLHLFIAGTGTEKDAVAQKIIDLKLTNNITLLGWIDPITPYLQRVAALIFPSLCLEAYGMAIIDAMRHGRAVIATNQGPTLDFITDGKQGLLFSAQQPQQLTDKIVWLAQHPEQTDQMGRAAFEHAKRLIDNEQALKKLLQVYQAIA